MAFSIDDLDIEGGDKRDPFVFTFPPDEQHPDGDSYEFLDPQEIPWAVLAENSIVEELRAAVLRYPDFAARTEVTGRFMTAVIRKWRAYYVLASPGEALASPRSSAGTARP